MLCQERVHAVVQNLFFNLIELIAKDEDVARGMSGGETLCQERD